jgi:thiol-disulfide isomerase/thioredoxin
VWKAIVTTWQLVATIVLGAALAMVAIQQWFLVHLIGQNGRVLLRLESLETMFGARAAAVAAAAHARSGSVVLEEPLPSGPRSIQANGFVPLPDAVGDLDPAVCGKTSSDGSPSVVDVGDPAPAVQLTDLAGHAVDLTRSLGTATLVLFWSPNCGYCQRMLPELTAWEANRPPDAPQLLVVSSGTVEENQGLGLRAPILLDPGFVAGQAFGARGTPSAVLINADGRVASQVVVGAPSVLALAGRLRTEPVATTSPECEHCLAECRERGGGVACVSLCAMTGECA